MVSENRHKVNAIQIKSKTPNFQALNVKGGPE